MEIFKGPESLKELFNGDANVQVPSFQRNYVWKNENVQQLLTDALSAGERADSHFFGPIVLLKSENTYEIIDGQQRITTAVMALCILRDLLEDKRYFPDDERAFIDNAIHALKSILFTGGLNPEPKFKAGYLIRRIYEAAIVTSSLTRTEQIHPNGAGLSPAEIVDTRELRRVYLHTYKHLSAMFEPLEVDKRKVLFGQLFRGFTEFFQVHSMVVASELDAYLLFESINYLGIKLEPGDLLKSLILRSIHATEPNNLVGYLHKWDSTIEHLHGHSLTKFLRHFVLAQTTSDVRTRQVFSYVKDLVIGKPDGAKQTLADLERSAKLYGYLLTPEGAPAHPNAVIHGVAERLNLISDTHRVLLLMILESTLTEAQKEKAFRAAEYLVFRTVCTRENAQDTQNKYQQLGNDVKLVKSNEDLDTWVREAIGGVATDNQLRSHVVSNCSHSGIQYDPREDLARYALAVISQEIGLGWKVDVTLEHLAPQTPATGSNWREIEVGVDAYDTVVHWWGNLTLLESPLNSSIGNREWSVKLDGIPGKTHPGLKASGYLLTKRVTERSEWNLNQIVERGDWLVGTLLGLRDSNWVDSGMISRQSIVLW